MTNKGPEIFFRSDFPEAIRPMVSFTLEREKLLAPLWCQRIEVAYDHDGEFIAMVNVADDYRRLYVTIGGPFLGESEESQYESILHELIHAFNGPIRSTVLENLEHVLNPQEDPRNASIFNIVNTAITKVTERCNQDLTYSLRRYRQSLEVTCFCGSELKRKKS